MKLIAQLAALIFLVALASACSGQSDTPAHNELPAIYLVPGIAGAGEEPRRITDAALQQAILTAISASMQEPLSEEEVSEFIFRDLIRSLFIPPTEFITDDTSYLFHGVEPVLIVRNEGVVVGHYHVPYGSWRNLHMRSE